jgi:ElaB/YqjD/DUF883 family membrane-anchored ribosome-binding protein
MTNGAGEPSESPAAGSPDETAKSPEELQRDIEQTRESLGDTVDALAQKADVKAQAKEVADEQKERLRAKSEEFKERVSGVAGGGDGDGDAAQQARRMMDSLGEPATRQPLPYLGGALVAGVVLGRLLLPRRRTR